MWIASKLGFFSIVFKEGHWHLRARLKRDLENLRAAAGLEESIENWPQADYRWRVRLAAEADLTRVFSALQHSIDYGNFKNQIAATPDQRAKLPAYHDLWGALCDLQRTGITPKS